ncbi:hypothetical protein F4823DRAFT_392923 [Ustulina deusta]|nr:hypothetical protein F4823DRAFT_392923 [Ustulina deusta]
MLRLMASAPSWFVMGMLCPRASTTATHFWCGLARTLASHFQGTPTRRSMVSAWRLGLIRRPMFISAPGKEAPTLSRLDS